MSAAIRIIELSASFNSMLRIDEVDEGKLYVHKLCWESKNGKIIYWVQ